MNEITTIKDAIRRINPPIENYSIVCTVSDIDLINSVCNCTPIDGSAVLVNVRINADNKDGFKLIPKDNTKVLVTLINNNTGFVSMVSEVNEIHLNGVNYGGLIVVAELTEKLNNLENAFNQHLTLYNLHTHAGVTSGSSTTSPVVVADTQVLTPTIETELENNTVLHGNGN